MRFLGMKLMTEYLEVVIMLRGMWRLALIWRGFF